MRYSQLDLNKVQEVRRRVAYTQQHLTELNILITSGHTQVEDIIRSISLLIEYAKSIQSELNK